MTFFNGSYLVFQNESKNIPSQDFLMTNISCQFEIYTYNTLCSRGPTKVLALSRINVPGGHLVFQNEYKNIPRQHFMVINISCKLEKASYNIFFVRAVMVKSLYTLRLSSGYNDLLNSENLKVAIAQLCHDIQVCNFTVIADQKLRE